MKAILLVAIQFACLGFILLTGPLFPQKASLLVLECAGPIIGLWAIWTMGLDNLRVMPHPRSHHVFVARGPHWCLRHAMYTALKIKMCRWHRLSGPALGIALTILFSANASAQSFRFAWLSDTHVGSTTGAEDLCAAVRDINNQTDIAFTIISGDVTELGKNSDLILAKSILDSLHEPYHIIPGNHDTKWSESGCTMFLRLWGDDRFVFEYQGYLFIGLHQGPIMRMGDGHFAPEDLRWLDSMLTRISHRDQPLVFVTHYPLDPSTDNWYEVLDRLKPFNTKAVLVGHGHVNKAEDFEGVPGIMGRSTLRAEKSEGGYNIVQVTADSMLSFERRPISETMDRWHAISLAPRNQGVHTHLRPDFSINRRYLSVRVRWAQTTGYTIASTPAVWNDVTVIGDRSGHVYCLSLKDGTTLWNFKTEAAVFSSPEIADGKVVFGSTDGFIYCLDVHNGDLLWEVQTNSPVVAAPRHDRGIVYIGGGDGRFRAIDLASGALLWHYDSVSAFVETKALAYEGKVIFGAWDTYLYALNAQDGSLEWKWSNGNPTVNLSPAACWPVASDSLVYVVAPDKFMSAINLRTGGTIWRSSAQRVRESIGFSEDRSRVFVRSTQDTLFCFAAHAATPTLLWATSCDFGYDIAPSMPVEKDGFVYFGTKNGLVCCVEGQTGVLKWKHKVAETIINTPAPAAQNGVVVTDFNGNCVLLEWTDSMRDTQK